MQAVSMYRIDEMYIPLENQFRALQNIRLRYFFGSLRATEVNSKINYRRCGSLSEENWKLIKK